MLGARLDRSLTLGIFRALSAGQASRGKRLPVLMYHSISDDPENGVHPYYKVATTPERFAEHMRWLGELGYIGASLETALAGLADAANSRRRVAITFDDGFRDFYTAAWPELQRRGFTATMYLPTGCVSSPRKTFRGKECMTWDEVRELRARGIQFGSHTVNHPKLHGLPGNEIDRELGLSRECLQRELGDDAAAFAYPYAYPQEDRGFTDAFTNLLRKHGYRNCATTMVGRVAANDDLFRLKRLPANSCDDRALYVAKLAGAYDWLGAVQRAVRRVKSWKTGAKAAPLMPDLAGDRIA
jgi:peptidoglycan/xylan/chitin deacetylase (PgdA/CDA1 family)